MILDQLVDAAIDGHYYTADGERVMLPLKSLIDMGLVDSAIAEKLAQSLDAWRRQRFDGASWDAFGLENAP